MIEGLLEALDNKKRRIDNARSLPSATLTSLKDDFVIRYAHETTALEDNTLTIYETQVVLKLELTIGGKTVREHLEVLNIRQALSWLDSLITAGAPITENTVAQIHRIVMQGILPDEAGLYRRVPIYIQGARHVPPNGIKVPVLMQSFGDQLKETTSDHPVRNAALTHIDLVRIHPFIDGNGRTARLLTNLLLLRAGYPPALYTTDQRRDYVQTLDAATFERKPDAFIQLTIEAVDRMADRYLTMIKLVEEGRESDGIEKSEPEPE